MIASRELRNHTADVLRRVSAGEQITITVNGKPVADLVPTTGTQRRHFLPTQHLLSQFRHPLGDTRLADDLSWISEGDTDELGPIR